MCKSRKFTKWLISRQLIQIFKFGYPFYNHNQLLIENIARDLKSRIFFEILSNVIYSGFKIQNPILNKFSLFLSLYNFQPLLSFSPFLPTSPLHLKTTTVSHLSSHTLPPSTFLNLQLPRKPLIPAKNWPNHEEPASKVLPSSRSIENHREQPLFLAVIVFMQGCHLTAMKLSRRWVTCVGQWTTSTSFVWGKPRVRSKINLTPTFTAMHGGYKHKKLL